jgi:hypothetical protein
MAKTLDLPVSLGIIRKNLPQIVASEVRNFIEFLESNGVSVRAKERNVCDLKPSQKDLNMDKIKDMADDPDILSKAVLTSQDNYLLDGHHRWASAYTSGKDTPIKCIEAQCPIEKLIELGRQFEGSHFKSIHEHLTRTIFNDCSSVFR